MMLDERSRYSIDSLTIEAHKEICEHECQTLWKKTIKQIENNHCIIK